MIILSNAGTHPEPAHLATGLVSAGTQLNYMTSASWAADSKLMVLADSAVGQKYRVGGQLRRRKLPSGITARNTVTTAAALDVLFQLMMRANLKSRDVILERRNRRHRHRVAHAVGRAEELHAVIAQYHSAYEPFLAASEPTMKILMYPIAHHEWMQETMRTEADANPRWAAFLQGYGMPTWKRLLLDEEIRLADKIIVPSTFVKSTFIQVGVDAEKIVVQNLGADIPSTNDLPSKIVRSDNSGTTFLFAGQVNQRKGIGYVLDAFAEVSKYDTRLLIAGHASTAMQHRLSEYAGVTYLGTMPHSALYAVMAEADVLLLPSFAEGFGLTALEAMANRCVPIVSHYTFASDIICDGVNGFVVDAGAVDQLVRHMTKLVSDPFKVATMQEEAQRSATLYTWQAYEKNASDMVLHMVREHARRRNG